MAKTTALLIIDPQNDFCDLPEAWCPADPLGDGHLRPALPVPGAHADMQRLAAWIDRHGHQLDAITLTLDAHHRFDIAHPGFWQGDGMTGVEPFTPITAAQVRAGRYAPRNPAHTPRALAYLDALEARGRYTLMVWPVHCQIGSWGQGVHAAVQAACNRWADAHGKPVVAVSKGDNPWTEHYSALQAEVPDAADPATAVNLDLLARLAQADHLLIAGEAGSHCVRATVTHLLDFGPADMALRISLLTDCVSPVAGFEAAQADFLSAMGRQGVRLTTSRQPPA